MSKDDEVPVHVRALIPSSDSVADSLGVARGSHAPRWVWRYSWRIHGYCLPMLHAFDRARSKDLDYSLKCLWCKALSGRDKSSPTFDGGLAYDMLPSGTRWVLRLPGRVFPRLIHFNIELRTAFLDRALLQEIESSTKNQKKMNTLLITLGAGYDTRSIRFLISGRVQEAWELDVPPVIASKEIMLERLRNRRTQRGFPVMLPQMAVQDLNQVEAFQETVSSILDSLDGNENDDWHVIFLLEGVLIYLNNGVPRSLLACCSSMLKREGLSGSLIFADLFRDLSSLDVESADDYFLSQGWNLVPSSWCVKPGLARHMGIARIIKEDR